MLILHGSLHIFVARSSHDGSQSNMSLPAKLLKRGITDTVRGKNKKDRRNGSGGCPAMKMGGILCLSRTTIGPKGMPCLVKMEHRSKFFPRRLVV
jgi:hypothetical protein